MHRRFLLAIAVVVIGGSLLASTATAAPEARKGGTLKGMFFTDVDFIDPSLAYYVHSWQIMGAVGAHLLRFADREGAAGSRLVPEVAAGFPTISRNGRTYTFTLKRTYRFSNGKPVRAANFKFAIERALNAQQQSPAGPFVNDIIGAPAVQAGRARTASGIRVLGPYRLQLRLARPAPDILARLAMPFFQAMDTAMGIDPKGQQAPIHTAGPYYIRSWSPNQRLVVARNPHYRGPRAANVNSIEYEAGQNLDAQVLKLRSGQADFAAEGISASAHADLARQFGINRGRYQVRQVPTTRYIALNTQKGITANANTRKAINWAVDRQAMTAQYGYLAGKRADQILPPGIPGFRDFNAYPLRFTESNLNRAKQLMGGRTGKFLMLSGTSATSRAVAQIASFNLAKIGIEVENQHLASGPLVAKAGSRGENFQGIIIGWHADYPDPNNFLDILLNGTNIQESNNNNFAYLNVASLNRRMEAASVLSGARRYAAYQKLDLDITRQHAPWASYMYSNNRDFISARTGCYQYHPTFSMNLATACIK